MLRNLVRYSLTDVKCTVEVYVLDSGPEVVREV